MEKQLEKQEAYVQAVVLGAYVDGELADEEREVLMRCIHEQAGNTEEGEKMLKFAARLPRHLPKMRGGWRAARIDQIRKALIEPSARRHAFALAVKVARVHNGIGLRESRLLLDLMDGLDIDYAFAHSLLATAPKPKELSRKPTPLEETLVSATN